MASFRGLHEALFCVDCSCQVLKTFFFVFPCFNLACDQGSLRVACIHIVSTICRKPALTIPSFTGLKAGSRAAAAAPARATGVPMAFSARASMKEAAAAAVAAAAASAVLASSALAAEVLLGGSDGSLAFVPDSLTVAAGEKIVFKNNAGFPHNVVFDEDAVPSGVDAAAISMSEEDLLNAPGETYSVTLKEKGTYSFYCSPHQGAGMIGKVTVN